MNNELVEKGEPCPKSGSYPDDEHGPAVFGHTCPYLSDINDDNETLCDCCENCTQECANDI